MEYKNNNPFIIGNWEAYYINLDSRKDRKKIIESELGKQGVNAARFPALSDKDFNKFTDLNLGRQNASPLHSSDKNRAPREFIPGEWGCAFSHYSILKKHLSSGSQKILAIFEDDAHFCSDFKKRLEYLANHFDLEWDIFYLGGFCKLIYDQKTNIKHVWKIDDVAYGTQAMLINQKSISKITGLMELYAPNVSAIDNLYIYLVPHLKMYYFVPGMVSQNSPLVGDIGGRINLASYYVKLYGPHVFAENLDDFNYWKTLKVVIYLRKYLYVAWCKIDPILGRIGIFLKNKFPIVYKTLKSTPL
ncbi:MAG: glycosyltransferase family 25 protein [Candidatus Staskawiczbacteria bacterium]|jgi:GR25 family glycosyltransferase involved in LPS biosynthesis